MKRLILIISLFAGVSCYGQKKDSLVIKGDMSTTRFIGGLDSAFWLTTGSVGDGLSLFNSTKRDTVRVLMLCVDTTDYPRSSMVYIRRQDEIFNEGKMAYWQFGYEVRRVEIRNNTDGVLDPYFTFGFKYNEWAVYSHESYLDQNKAPLPKSIVVWITKETKN